MQTSHCGSRIAAAAAATWTHEGTHLIYGFLAGNRSWIWIRCIQHASHRHNFMSPQNWLCRSERNPALDTLALNSPLGHLNGDNPYSPQIPDTKLTVTSKVQFLQQQRVFRQKCNEHKPSHVRRHTLPSQLLITQFRLNTHNPSRVLQHQKQTQNSMLQIKPYSKNTFRLSPSYFFIFLLLLFLTNLARGLTTLSG